MAHRRSTPVVTLAFTLALVVASVLGACGVEADPSAGSLPGGAALGGSTTTFPLRPGATSTTEPGSGASTTTTAPSSASGVSPSKIPAGYKPLTKEGIGIGIAVPKAWTDPGLDVDDLAKGADALGEQNSELGSIAGMFGALTDDAEMMAAVGSPVGARRDSVVVIQLSMSLPTIPQMVVDQAEQQVRSMGATDVEAKLVSVPGLDEDVRALDLSATMTYGTQRVPIRELMVPTDLGIALLVVGADRVTADTILSTVGA